MVGGDYGYGLTKKMIGGGYGLTKKKEENGRWCRGGRRRIWMAADPRGVGDL